MTRKKYKFSVTKNKNNGRNIQMNTFIPVILEIKWQLISQK